MEDKRKHDHFEEDDIQFDGDAMEMPIIRATRSQIEESTPVRGMNAPYLDHSIAIMRQLQAQHPILKPLYKLICSHSFATHSKILLDIIELLDSTYKIMHSQINQSISHN
jgi:hypothetical protein